MDIKRIKQLAGLNETYRDRAFIEDLHALKVQWAKTPSETITHQQAIQAIDALIRKHYGKFTDI